MFSSNRLYQNDWMAKIWFSYDFLIISILLSHFDYMEVFMKILKAFAYISFFQESGYNQTLEEWNYMLHGNQVSIRFESLHFLCGVLVYGYHNFVEFWIS